MSEATFEAITRAASHGRPRARLEALRQLRHVLEDERAIDFLISVAQGPDEPLRPDAVRLLGESRSQRAVDPLIALLDRCADEPNEDVAPEAAAALGELGDQRATPALVKLLRTRDDDDALFMAHRQALFALAALGVPGPIQEFIDDDSRPEILREEAATHMLPRAAVTKPRDP